MSTPTLEDIRLFRTATTELPENWTLLLPAVSVGNVGQLAIDLFLSSFDFEHVGHLHTAAILPFAAPPPEVPAHSCSVITGLELYRLRDTTLPIFVIQQRSPSVQGRTAEFGAQIVRWAVENNCAEIVLLSGANAAGLRGVRLDESQAGSNQWAMLRVAVTSAALGDGRLGLRATKALNWKVLENAQGDSRGWSEAICNNVQLDLLRRDANVPAFLPSSRKGSFVRTLLEESDSRNVSLTTLVHFVHEGDNIGDAMFLASAATYLLQLPFARDVGRESEEREAGQSERLSCWKIPRSWVEKGDLPRELY